MLSGVTGGSGGGSSSTSTKVATLPSWLQPTVESLVSRANTLSNQSYTPYEGDRVAGFTDDQMAAFDQLRNSIGATDQTFADATGLAGELGQGLTQDQIQSFINPYQQNVTDIQKREALKDYDTNLAKLRGSTATAGAFGGDRAAILESQLQQNAEQGLMDLQAIGTRDAYNNAISTANASNATRATGLEGLLKAGQGSQAARLNDIQALVNSGTQQQQQAQTELDIPYQDYLTQQDYPYKQLDFLSGITNPVMNTMAGSTTNSTSAETKGKGSFLGNLVGTAMTVAPYVLKEGGKVPQIDEDRKYAGGGLLESISGLFGGGGDGSAGGMMGGLLDGFNDGVDDSTGKFDLRSLVGGNLNELFSKLGLGGASSMLFNALSGDDNRSYNKDGSFIKWNGESVADRVSPYKGAATFAEGGLAELELGGIPVSPSSRIFKALGDGASSLLSKLMPDTEVPTATGTDSTTIPMPPKPGATDSLNDLTPAEIQELERSIGTPVTDAGPQRQRQAPAPSATQTSALMSAIQPPVERQPSEKKASGNRALLNMGLAMLANQDSGPDFFEQLAAGFGAFDATKQAEEAKVTATARQAYEDQIALLKLQAELGDKESLAKYRAVMADAALRRASRPSGSGNNNVFQQRMAATMYEDWLNNADESEGADDATKIKKLNEIMQQMGVDLSAPVMEDEGGLDFDASVDPSLSGFTGGLSLPDK